jgi:aminoacyl tRNA synthase complex-interacting multifunctional protein 1
MSLPQATSKDGKDAGIEIIQPPANSEPGDRVYFDGSEFQGMHPHIFIQLILRPFLKDARPLSQLNPKKKVFETIQPGKFPFRISCIAMVLIIAIYTGFVTLDSKEAAWINPSTKSVHKIQTKKGVCVAPTLVGASLS